MKYNDRRPVIYMYVSPKGKRYIGKSTNMHKRHYCHQHAGIMSKVFAKYGVLDYIILKICDHKEDLDKYEKAFIKMYNTVVPNGYNITDGGQVCKYTNSVYERKRMFKGGKKGVPHGKRSVEFKEMMSKIGKARYANMTDEERERDRAIKVKTCRDSWARRKARWANV